MSPQEPAYALRKEIRVPAAAGVCDLRQFVLLDPRFSQAWGTNLNSNIVTEQPFRQARRAHGARTSTHQIVWAGSICRTSSFGQVWGHNLNSSIVDSATIRF